MDFTHKLDAFGRVADPPPRFCCLQSLKSFEGFRAVAPVRAARTVQVAFRRTPLKIEAARVGGVEIPNQKYIEYSLQYIYGIGPTTAKAILRDTVRGAGPAAVF